MKFVTRVIVSLGIGAAMTIGVAWGVALDDLDATQRDIVGGVIASSQHVQRWGELQESRACRIWWETDVARNGQVSWRRPWWAPSIDDRRSAISIAAGYPMPALASDYRAESAWHATMGIGLEGEWSFHGLPTLQRTLPVRPVWSGLVLNTVACAAIIYVPLFGHGHARRALRRRRGLCVACAYPVARDTCPECGRVVA